MGERLTITPTHIWVSEDMVEICKRVVKSYGELYSEKYMENIGKRVKLRPSSVYYHQMVDVGTVEIYNNDDYRDHHLGVRWPNGNFYHYRFSDIEFIEDVKESKENYTNQIASDLAKLK